MATHQTAKTQYISTSRSPKFAYRRLGTSPGTPLLILTHFRGVMDNFDPLLINTLSQSRSLILADYVGVGLSTGDVATTVAQSAADILEFLSLIGETEIDVLGFSLGGMVAQLVALNADPAKLKVRKLIIAGTTPSAGPGIEASPNAQDVNEKGGAQNVDIEVFKTLFFPRNREGAIAVEQWWARINERGVSTSGEEPATFLSQGYADGAKGLMAQGAQIASWSGVETSRGEEGSFERLKGLRIPVLVANGHDDYMVPTVNSWVAQQQLPNAQLIVYPNSGHGFLFQYAALFAKHVVLFLEA
ncbi:Alpha/Beta hydrolase protein [Cercophora newfieldiana]|uniref:Alpha/Beta hydrolase protein n=1 Tax=Cercophora newfieldiana TaxID=92897 RepID=A0AA40CHY1_9PEZI|nr:Alpha/Beta hydrolase protein [Cercophora newfieldiana]